MELSLGSWIFIACTLLLLVLILLGTWIEHRSMKISRHVESVVLPFSLINNGKMLLMKTPAGRIGSMNGIRVISSCLIIAYHRFKITPEHEPLLNLYPFHDVLNHDLVEPLLSVRAGSEIFFLLGGTLLARGFMAERKSEIPFSYAKHILNRYLRITPLHLVLILIHMTVSYELGSGRSWEKYAAERQEKCSKNWWLNMLYINNYVHADKMCMERTWYLAVDMQLYIVAPLFLFVIYKERKLGVTLTIITILLSCIHMFQIWQRLLQGNDAIAGEEFHIKVYFRTENKVSSYLLGVLLGVFLERFKKRKISMSRSTQRLGWTVSTIVLITFIYLPRMIQRGWVDHPRTFGEIPYGAFFSAAVAWIIFACDQGYGGSLNRFLSHHYFQVLSRLSFAVYLVHLEVIHHGTPSNFPVLPRLLCDIILSNLVAVILCLTVEYPCMNLVDLFIKKKKVKKSNEIYSV